MSEKGMIASLIESITGYTVYKHPPFGISPFHDLIAKYKDFPFKVIFDVGANEGQSARSMRGCFPDAEIWCFEPVSQTYQELLRQTGDLDLRHHQVGFGAVPQEAVMMVDKENRMSDTNSLVSSIHHQQDALVSETIQIDTLDAFCEREGVSNIDYLKVDTEGYDLTVLQGAARLLQENCVAFIETEVSMNPGNKLHVPFELMKEYLEANNYRLFGIYEQVQEWRTRTPILRRSNIVFVAAHVYSRYSKRRKKA